MALTGVFLLVMVGAANGKAFSAVERVARSHCDQSHPVSCIHRAALHYGIDFGTMKYIARRESRFDPWAKNPSSTASGLFQFLTSTYAVTPMARRGHSIFSAKWNSLAAAWYMRRFGYSAWACC